MMVAWTRNVEVKEIWKTEFYIKMLVPLTEEVIDLWIICIYASTEGKERKRL